MRKVVPQLQANRHKPDEGLYGDCHRTAIAVLLGLDREEVPHFASDNCTTAVFTERVSSWLDERGLMQLWFVFDGGDLLSTILTALERLNPGVPYLLGGRSRTGVNHTVVCQGGEIVCDPSQTGAGIVGPTDGGYYHVNFIVSKATYAE